MKIITFEFPSEVKTIGNNHGGILGGTVGAGVRAVAALGRLTEGDDSDNPEEQKRKQEAKEEKLLENQELFKTPIVRNGKKATLGYCPDEWKKWEEEK